MDVVWYLLWCKPSVIPRPSFECLQYSMHFTSDHKPEARKAQEWGYTTICVFLIFAELFGLNYDFLKSCIVMLPYLLIQSALVLDVTSSTLLRTTVQGERVPCWIAPLRSTIPACVTTPWTLELSVVSESYSCPACLIWKGVTPPEIASPPVSCAWEPGNEAPPVAVADLEGVPWVSWNPLFWRAAFENTMRKRTLAYWYPPFQNSILRLEMEICYNSFKRSFLRTLRG